MYTECRHVFSSGRKCTEAMVQHSVFCYRHRNLQERKHAPAPRPGTPFRMPLLEDEYGCYLGVQETLWALGEKRITQKEAGTYLYGVNIAKSLLPRRPAATRKPVRSLCYDNDGFEMAEPVNTCEPPRDCLTCQKYCDLFEYYEDEVKELEEQIAAEEEQKRLEAQKAASGQPEAAEALTPGSEATDQPAPRKGKYDHELPNVRRLFEIIERKAEIAQEFAEKQARQKAEHEATCLKAPAGAPF